jgi:hypothetical protein
MLLQEFAQLGNALACSRDNPECSKNFSASVRYGTNKKEYFVGVNCSHNFPVMSQLRFDRDAAVLAKF